MTVRAAVESRGSTEPPPQPHDCLPGDSTSPATSGIIVAIMRTPLSDHSSLTHEPVAKTTRRCNHQRAPPLRPRHHGETLSNEPLPPLTSQIASPPPHSALGAAPHRPHRRLGRNRPATASAAMGSQLPCFACGLLGPTRVL
jgi:hypothetical protein